MKKIFSIILTVSAMIAIVPLAKADGEGESSTIQEGRDYILDGAIGYKKSISTPDKNGVYTITLESFATGSSQKVQKSVRSDIVLVLDVSTSMNEILTYEAEAGPWNAQNIGDNHYYLYNGNYYPVISYNGNLYINFGYDYSYLGSNYSETLYKGKTRIRALKDAVSTFIDLINDNDVDNAPAGQERLGNRIAIVTYGRSATVLENFTPLTNAATLKQTVENINVPTNNGTNTHYGMEEAYKLLSGSSSTAQIKTCVLFTDGNPGQAGDWEGANGYAEASENYREYNGQRRYEWTWHSANETINYADKIKKLTKENSDPTLQVIANVFTVSIIPEESTSDYTKVYLGKASSDWLGATNMGSITVTRSGGGYGGYTYTTTGWKSPMWDNGNGSRNPKSKDYSTTDNDDDKTDFSLAASSAAELKAAFETIAGETGGGALPMSEESIAEVDVVSASFTLPSETDPEDIVIKIAECYANELTTFIEDGVQKTEKFLKFRNAKTIDIFANPKVLSGYTYTKKVTKDGVTTEYPNTPVDGSLALSFAKSKPELTKEDMVILTGFDYGGNFCGPVYEEGWKAEMEGSEDHISGYRGYKIILEIPIKMNPTAVGGPDVDTNGPGSGIKVNGTQAVTFVSPHVSLPVNIWIRKNGLEVGESAKFTIQRAVIPEAWKDPDWEKPSDSTDPVYNTLGWENVSSVFVTRHSGQAKSGVNAPTTKAIGLPSVDDQNNEYIYRIIENTDWSWSYNPGTTKIFTSDQLETNPFEFYNTKKNKINVDVRHAESKATNTFKNGNFVVDGVVKKKVNTSHVGFDDSKSNGRTVIEVTSNNQQQ